MRHWTQVTITDGEQDYDATSPRGLRALTEYRARGTMAGAWPCTCADLAACGEDTTDAGIDPDQIDWAGFGA